METFSILLKFVDLTQVEVLQVFLSIFLIYPSYLLSKYAFFGNDSTKKVGKMSFSEQYVQPVLSYAAFLLLFSVLSAIFYLYTKDLTVFDLGVQGSFLVFLSSYVFVLTKRWGLSLLVFLVLAVMWGVRDHQLIQPILSKIDQYSVTFGAFTLSPTRVIKAVFILVLGLWVIQILSKFVKTRLKKVRYLQVNTREVIAKSVDVCLYFLGMVVLLNSLGVNLSALAFVGGALGVGLGFGLQKITSNFVSGFILLFEKAIKIDDLVEVDNSAAGFVRKLGVIFTIVETFDGKEILIPNEDFISSRVTNLTYSNRKGRIDITIGVAYHSDLSLVQKLLLEAALAHPNCMQDPAPACYLREFADSSVNFLLFFFVDDVTSGRMQTRSEVMMSIWEKFKAHQIEIPFPQRDVNIKSGAN